MDDYTFMVQRRTFDVHGYALNPSVAEGVSGPIVGSLNLAHQNGYDGIDTMKVSRAQQREIKRKRGRKGDLDVVDGDGAYVGPWAEWEGEKDVDPVVEEEAEEWREEKRRREEATVAAKEKMKVAREEKSIFHGTSTVRHLFVLNSVCRQGAHRLCRENIHARTDRCGCQAQSVRGICTSERICPRTVYTHLGKFLVAEPVLIISSDRSQQGHFRHPPVPQIRSLTFEW